MTLLYSILAIGAALSLLGLGAVIASLWSAKRRGVPLFRGFWMPADRLTPRERRLNRGGFAVAVLGVLVLGALLAALLSRTGPAA